MMYYLIVLLRTACVIYDLVGGSPAAEVMTSGVGKVSRAGNSCCEVYYYGRMKSQTSKPTGTSGGKY